VSEPPTSVYPESGAYWQLAPSARGPVQLPATVPTGAGGNVHDGAGPVLTTGAAVSVPFVHRRVKEPDTSVEFALSDSVQLAACRSTDPQVPAVVPAGGGGKEQDAANTGGAPVSEPPTHERSREPEDKE